MLRDTCGLVSATASGKRSIGACRRGLSILRHTEHLKVNINECDDLVLLSHLNTFYLPADFTGLVSFERLLYWFAELLTFLNDSKPERCQLIVVIAGTMSVTFNNGVGTEIFQTRAWRNEILAKTAAVIGCGLEKRRICLSFMMLPIIVEHVFPLPSCNCSRSTILPS